MGERLQHYLITIPLSGGYVHGYVMTDDESVLTKVASRLLGDAERRGFKCSMPMVLQTRLGDGWEIVRDVINGYSAEPAGHWKRVKNFHLTGWYMREGHPDEDRLMALH